MARKKPSYPPEGTGDCNTCWHWKMRNSRIKGKLIPHGFGKCTREGGPCHPEKTRGEKEKGDVPHTSPETTPQPPSHGSHEVTLSLIYPNPRQPRKFFPREALEELALSIKEQGLIEPLVVVRQPRIFIADSPGPPISKEYMLVAGERRWRACQMVGVEKVPVRVIEADDRQIAEMALVENLQRQDLTPLEEARAFQEMLDKGYTKEELAQKLGFKQVWRVDERLSLLNLAPRFQEALLSGLIGNSQAFEMSRLADQGDQELVFQKIRAGELSTYNRLRQFVTALVTARKEQFLFAPPRKEELEVVRRWEKALDAVTSLIVKSFSPDDCRVLAKVVEGNAQANLMKIDLIVKHLNLIKKALLENASREEVVNLTDGGASCGGSLRST